MSNIKIRTKKQFKDVYIKVDKLTKTEFKKLLSLLEGFGFTILRDHPFYTRFECISAGYLDSISRCGDTIDLGSEQFCKGVGEKEISANDIYGFIDKNQNSNEVKI